MNTRSENRSLLIISLLALSFIIITTLFYVFFGNRLIEKMYEGESLEFLNKAIAQHRIGRPWANLEHYYTLGRLLYSRVLLICIAIYLIVIAGLKYRSLMNTGRGFFSAATHPINLAIFRVVLFYMIFDAVDVSKVTWFSQIPAELRVAPQGLGWLIVDYLPINATFAKFAAQSLLLCSFTAMVGLFTRVSALLTTVLSFYVLAIPQLYGKVNHYHHLLWFAAILAASRCADVLSCDAIVAAWRRADDGVTAPPGPSRIYALPLRFVWLLLGVIYFFPGFWKLWNVGVDWVLSDNLKFMMYTKWVEVGGWTPVFRIDQYPLLYKLSALASVAFEVSFIFLIFSRRFRILAPLGGLIFHSMTTIFMRISFDLWTYYVAFFDWNAIFHWLGRHLYSDQMHIFYDGNRKLCRRTIASLRVLDICGRVTYINILDHKAMKGYELERLDPTILSTDLHAIVGKRRWTGLRAYRVLAVRIPILWLVVPFLYLWPITVIGSRIYRRIADSIQRKIPLEVPATTGSLVSSSNLSFNTVLAVGILLLVGNILAGSGDVHYAWPFAAYPSFAGLATAETQLLEIVAQNSAGELIPVTQQTLGRNLSIERFWGLTGVVLSAPDDAQRRIRLKAFWQVFAQGNMRLQHAENLQFYKVTLSTIPERWKDNPISRELVLELKL